MQTEGSLDDRPRTVRFQDKDDIRVYQKDTPEANTFNRALNPKMLQYNHDHDHRHSNQMKIDQKVLDQLRYREVKYLGNLDIATATFGIFSVILCYVAYFNKEMIINDLIYDKFQEHRSNYAESSGLTMIRIIPEAIKLFSLCAYDIMVVLYLVKPIKSLSTEERTLMKQHQETMKALSAMNVQNVDKEVAKNGLKKLEEIQRMRSEMMSSRYVTYNLAMLHVLKSALSLDFIIACLGMASFFVTNVTYV